MVDTGTIGTKKKAETITDTRRWIIRNPTRIPRNYFSEEDRKEAYKTYNKACIKAKRQSFKDFVGGMDTLIIEQRE